MLLHIPLYFFPFLQRQACLKICLYTLISASLLYSSAHYSSDSALITLLKALKITHILANSIIGRTDAETPILWSPDGKNWRFKRPWCWERLRAGGEGDNRGWHGWVASSTWWTWVLVDSGSWWWTGSPGMLRFMESQRADTTEWLNWTELMKISLLIGTRSQLKELVF